MAGPVKRRRTSKTYWFAVFCAGFGAAQEAMPQIAAMIDPQWYPKLFVLVGIAVAVLREVTDRPVGKGE